MLALLLIPLTSHAATLTVNPDGSGDATSIQRAIRAASSGDTIEIAAGTYAENLDSSGKSLTIRGASATTTVISAGGDVGLTIDGG